VEMFNSRLQMFELGIGYSLLIRETYAPSRIIPSTWLSLLHPIP
jgi:hypothetical protein